MDAQSTRAPKALDLGTLTVGDEAKPLGPVSATPGPAPLAVGCGPKPLHCYCDSDGHARLCPMHAAAPDLLAALRAVANMHPWAEVADGWGHVTNECVFCSEWHVFDAHKDNCAWVAARAALARAEGA